MGIIISNHYKDPYLTTGAEILPKATHLGASHLGCLSEAQRELVRNFWIFSGGQMVGQSHEMRFFFNLSHFGWHLGHVPTQQGFAQVPFHQACWTEWKNKTLHYTRHCERREVRQFGWNWYPGIPATWFNDHGSMILSYTPGVEMRQHAASMILSSGLANSLGKIFPSFVELRLGYEIVCFKKFFSLIARHGLSTLAVKKWACHRNCCHACHTNQPYGNGCLVVRFRNHLWPTLSLYYMCYLFFFCQKRKRKQELRCCFWRKVVWATGHPYIDTTYNWLLQIATQNVLCIHTENPHRRTYPEFDPFLDGKSTLMDKNHSMDPDENHILDGNRIAWSNEFPLRWFLSEKTTGDRMFPTRLAVADMLDIPFQVEIGKAKCMDLAVQNTYWGESNNIKVW